MNNSTKFYCNLNPENRCCWSCIHCVYEDAYYDEDGVYQDAYEWCYVGLRKDGKCAVNCEKWKGSDEKV